MWHVRIEMALKLLRQYGIELTVPNSPSPLNCRFTDDGMVQPCHGLCPVGDDLDQTPALEARDGIGLADRLQDVPV